MRNFGLVPSNRGVTEFLAEICLRTRLRVCNFSPSSTVKTCVSSTPYS